MTKRISSAGGPKYGQRPYGLAAAQQPAPLAERQRPKVGAIEPGNVERHVGGRARVSEKVVELWSAGFVGRDHLAVENGIVDVKCGRHLLGEPVEPPQRVAV